MLSGNSAAENVGFFKDLHSQFRLKLNADDEKRFASLTSDLDRVKLVYEWNVAKGCLYRVEVSGGKDQAKALELKEQGNKAFQVGHYTKSIHFYNRSLQFFPTEPGGGRDVSVTRANRSAALYHLEMYREALKDIQSAVEAGYPKDLMYKVRDRKARCLLALKQHRAALKAFQETMTSLDDSKLKLESKQKWQRDVQIIMSMLAKTTPPDDKTTKIEEEEKLEYKRNQVYPAASDSVSIRRSDTQGRYAVASRDIGAGEILVVERPYCAVLLDQYADTNCFNCFKRVEVAEPCPWCSHVVFCGGRCMKEATSSHHRTECSVLRTLWSSGLSVTCLMALRIVALNPPQFFLQHVFEEETEKLWEKKVYRSADYDTVYNLVRHEALRTPENLLHRANIAVFLLQCLKAGDYFGRPAEESEEMLVGGLILRHLQILQFNAHEVSELRVRGNNFNNSTSTFIGGAVFPTLALFNHSCNPSITRYFKGTTVVTRAIRNVKKGEMIAENYGPMFTQTRRDERQVALRSQYWFDCTCEACLADWPVMDSMDVSELPFRCSTVNCDNVIKVPLSTTVCLFDCNKCSKSNSIMKGLKVLQDTEDIFRVGMALLEEGQAERALSKFLELYNLVDEVLAPPFKDYHLCQQAIRTCLLTRGNKYITQPPK